MANLFVFKLSSAFWLRYAIYAHAEEIPVTMNTV